MSEPELYRAPKLCHTCGTEEDTGGDAETCHSCWTNRQLRAGQAKFLGGGS